MTETGERKIPRRVLVTGASRGIGLAVAERLAGDGYAVGMNCVCRVAEAEKAAQRLRAAGADCAVFQADISREQDVQRLLDAFCSRFSGIPEILINNAGISLTGVLPDATDADFDRVFGVNVKGMFLLCRGVYDSMVSAKWGRIVNISSMWGEAGASCEVLYSASKSAVNGFTKALAKELAPSGVTVNAVAPGVIRTEMLSCYSEKDLEALRTETPAGRLGTPEDVADAVRYLVSEEASFVTGQILGVDGGFLL
ncbi:MAG: 3-oxoacyl-ACP reductase FabG [Clostridia bacterium]|nr:3-oxoacyl-ACP reductase FabG [Clostridia bacterium]